MCWKWMMIKKQHSSSIGACLRSLLNRRLITSCRLAITRSILDKRYIIKTSRKWRIMRLSYLFIQVWSMIAFQLILFCLYGNTMFMKETSVYKYFTLNRTWLFADIIYHKIINKFSINKLLSWLRNPFVFDVDSIVE